MGDSEACRQADLAQLERTIASATEKAQTQLDRLYRQEFSCDADALEALESLTAQLPWHHLSEDQVSAKAHHDRPGKPKFDTVSPGSLIIPKPR